MLIADSSTILGLQHGINPNVGYQHNINSIEEQKGISGPVISHLKDSNRHPLF